MPAYDNRAVASKLDLYADLLEISGADTYRTLSYRKAANSIRAWPEQVATLVEQGRLTEIPGVGKKLAGIVEQVVASGSFGDLDALSARVPPGLAAVMRVPGIGPKRASLLHDKLGVASLEDLSNALCEGRVERLGGFGAKTAAKIAASLESHLVRCQRTPIAVALPIAERLVADIASLPSVMSVELAGSVRRRQDTVGNIDVVVSAPSTTEAADDIERLPAVERVLERGPGALSLELHDGMRVDVRVVDPAEFPVALRYYTGSVEHNRAFEMLGAMNGVEVGESRVFREGRPVEVRDERALFQLVNSQTLPPEAREGTETLAQAAQQHFPELVDLADVKGDLQSHSTFTDGKSTLERNREVAAELGYEYIAATDHAYALRMVGGLAEEDIRRQWETIDELNAATDGPLILKGIELNIAEDGSVDYDDELLEGFDIALASLHSGWEQDEATITARLLTAMAHPLVDVIAHPTGRILGRRDPLKLDMDTVLAAAGESGTIMEINSYPDRLDLSREHIILGRTYGVRFSLGTDAHAAEQLRYMPYGVSQARRGLVTRDELINAHPWSVARTMLKRYRSRNG